MMYHPRRAKSATLIRTSHEHGLGGRLTPRAEAHAQPQARHPLPRDTANTEHTTTAHICLPRHGALASQAHAPSTPSLISSWEETPPALPHAHSKHSTTPSIARHSPLTSHSPPPSLSPASHVPASLCRSEARTLHSHARSKTRSTAAAQPPACAASAKCRPVLLGTS